MLENMLKGYIPTWKKGKLPTEEVKGRKEFYSLDAVKQLDSYGGVLEDDVIMIDVDDMEESNLLHSMIDEMGISCNIIKTTRGKHFYFRNVEITKECTNKTSCVGISHMDIKLGINNRITPLKIDGEYREVLREVEELDFVPRWLKPVRANVDFKMLDEGSGRNQALFNYILTLQQTGMSKDEVKETITLINKYILKDPIGEKELDTILRDDAFMKQSFYDERGKLQFQSLANYLKHEYNIIKIDSQLHIYHKGVYVRDTDEIERLLIKYITNSTKSARAEMLRWLELVCEEYKPASERYILFKNGIYDIYEDTLLAHDPSMIFQNMIPWNYNPNAESKSVDKLLNKVSCNDENIRALIEEMFGFCLYRRSEIGKFFILTGEGSNGKSTTLEMLIAMLGEDNISSISMKNLTKRFNAFHLHGKLANVGDDISGAFIEESEDLKKMTIGERMTVEEKGKNPYIIKPYAKLIFSANDIPKVKDSSFGFKRRMMIIPFNAKIRHTDSDFDPRIKDKVLTTESMEYVILLALEGLKRVTLTNTFTQSAKVVKELEEYHRTNNPILDFVEEKEGSIENNTTKYVYRMYTQWCYDNGYNPLTSRRFTLQLKTLCSYATKQTRMNGERVQIYVSI
ncbi:DNA primase family protein [Zhenhengia yiwuensis]|uniref:DNA primase n=1 Tax=Zhenhengia yiwuensis TaxID=2763666 RepID=A0A926EGJ4_9FIRM|nr:phage/plasmid primase, P4 family [Zhenhengia yiwuensis]MBC8579149.1 DNA primase [Zhenhengia yiwuensis]